MIILRDMIESDITDYVRWFTVETDWMNYDAPWESSPSSLDEELKSWTEYYQSVKDLTKDEIRWKFEIEVDGHHIGWVSRYFDLEYLDNSNNNPAIGIDIPEMSFCEHGIGTEALGMFIEYLKKAGYERFYIQTWSGNKRMLRVAEKLGFSVICCKKDYRKVNDKNFDALTLML